jgi:uncharacterized protein (TIGR02118 family)
MAHDEGVCVLKVVWILTFRPEADRAAVTAWWRSDHARAVLQVPGVKRYVQNLYIHPDASEASDASAAIEGADAGLDFDAIAEWWFDDEQAFADAVASPEWQAVLAETATGFDVDVVQGGFIREHIMRWSAQYDGRSYMGSGHAPD